MESIIKLENVSVAYNLGKSNEFWALKDINLEIYPGEYVIFFGPSGCGKSTLLYTIAGLEFPARGKAIVKGQTLGALSSKKLVDFYRSTVGIVFQAYYLIADLSARDNILLSQFFTGVSPTERKKKVEVLIQRFNLGGFVEKKPSLLSGGQQQRISIARALINDPAIILADEPVGNLDSQNAEIVIDLLTDLNKKDKKTIIHVTHDPRYLHHANRIFYVKDGKIIRITTNPEKKALTPFKLEISELERIAQAYPYLSESRLRAKLILNHLLFPFGIEDQQKIEKVIDDYLLKKIDQERLEEILDQPSEKGGVSLYTQTAQNLTKKIAALVKEIEIIKEEEYPELTQIKERAIALRGFLLDGYSGQLSFEQIQRLEGVIQQRLIDKLNKEDFKKFLDLPIKKGGVGLNRRTAKRFTREIELILMKK